MSLQGKFILHSLALAAMTYGYHNLGRFPMGEWIMAQYGGHSQFLTIQGLALAWTTMIFSLIHDILPAKPVGKLKRFLLMLSLPVSVVVSLIYWSLIAFFPHLILAGNATSAVAFWIPLDIDVALHAVPAISLTLDFLLFEPRFTEQEAAAAPKVTFLFGTWYSLWAEHCARMNGLFPYPFLNNPPALRILIYVISTMIGFQSFLALNIIHQRIKRTA